MNKLLKNIMRITGILISLGTAALSGFATEIGEYTDPSEIIYSNPGKIVIIMLKSNPTTGYKWKLNDAQNNDIVSFMNSEYLQKKSGILGGDGTEIWSFRAIKTGTTVLQFNYIRPWEDGVPDKTMEFTISVDEPEYEENVFE